MIPADYTNLPGKSRTKDAVPTWWLPLQFGEDHIRTRTEGNYCCFFFFFCQWLFSAVQCGLPQVSSHCQSCSPRRLTNWRIERDALIVTGPISTRHLNTCLCRSLLNKGQKKAHATQKIRHTSLQSPQNAFTALVLSRIRASGNKAVYVLCWGVIYCPSAGHFLW